MSKGASTKGYIKNLDSGAIHPFMFNPTSFSDKHGVAFSEIKSAGSPYPKYQYVGGVSKSVSVELFLYDKYKNGVKKEIAFLNDFLPVAKNGTRYKRPPLLMFAFGWYVKTCIMDDISVDYKEFDRYLNPTMATVKLSLRMVV